MQVHVKSESTGLLNQKLTMNKREQGATREKASCESSCMMRWIFRIIAMAVAGKLVNRYLGSRPQRRSRGNF